MFKLNWVSCSVVALTIILHGCGKSDFSNCVVAQDEKSYTGDWLEHVDGSQRTMPTLECRRLDAEIDHADGNRKGRVRWAVCSNGPDCSEAGMF